MTTSPEASLDTATVEQLLYCTDDHHERDCPLAMSRPATTARGVVVRETHDLIHRIRRIRSNELARALDDVREYSEQVAHYQGLADQLIDALRAGDELKLPAPEAGS